METILITGGSGLVGRTLTDLLLKKGYQVIILTRKITDKNPKPNLKYALWDIKKNAVDVQAILESDYIIHLAGAGVVDKKWTAVYQQEIVDSRVNSSSLIIETLKNNPNKVKALISSSAIGWYGPDLSSNYQFVETDKHDNSFLGNTCKLWEDSVDPAQQMGIRVCKLRTGIVLSTEGGALKEFLKPIKLGVAAILGNGKQMVSWIHINDLCRMFLFAIENKDISGSYNAVAPHPVSNKNLTLSLAKQIKGRFFMPSYVPSFILKLMMGKRSIEVLKSCYVSAEKISKSGFTFFFPSIEVALKDLFSKKL
jgi:uncharacterized protein (TIGR01777 family)